MVVRLSGQAGGELFELAGINVTAGPSASADDDLTDVFTAANTAANTACVANADVTSVSGGDVADADVTSVRGGDVTDAGAEISTNCYNVRD